jgi:hypothetical protein
LFVWRGILHRKTIHAFVLMRGRDVESLFERRKSSGLDLPYCRSARRSKPCWSSPCCRSFYAHVLMCGRGWARWAGALTRPSTINFWLGADVVAYGVVDENCRALHLLPVVQEGREVGRRRVSGRLPREMRALRLGPVVNSAPCRQVRMSIRKGREA